MNNPFLSMASILAAAEPTAPKRRINTPNGKTNVLRNAICPAGNTARELANIAKLPKTSLVWSLLKGDIDKGLIEIRDGLYRRPDKP